MSSFDHPNVMKLIGVCLDGGPAPYIILPFMFNGNLLTYLNKNRKDLMIPPEENLDNESNVSVNVGACMKPVLCVWCRVHDLQGCGFKPHMPQ